MDRVSVARKSRNLPVGFIRAAPSLRGKKSPLFHLGIYVPVTLGIFRLQGNLFLKLITDETLWIDWYLNHISDHNVLIIIYIVILNDDSLSNNANRCLCINF